MEILIDHRELRSGVAGYLQKRLDAEIRFEQLSFGDYCIDGLYLFERKTLPDLIASIKDGRIFQQACRLACAQQRSIIILEGTTSSIKRSKMQRESIQGVLIQISIFLGIPLLRSKDAEETAKLIIYTAGQAQKLIGQPNHIRHIPHKRPKTKFKTQMYILQGIPGIGPKRAKALLNHFETIEAIFCASSDEITEVSGINKKTAQTISWAVKEPVPHGAGEIKENECTDFLPDYN